MSSLLMVLTGARTWTLKDGTAHPTGFWAEEFVVPHRMFTGAGLDVTITTLGGVTPVADELSLSLAMNGEDADKVADLRTYLAQVQGLLAAAMPLEEVDPASFDAVFIPGGHGPMQDLATSPPVAEVLATLLDDPTKVVASVCHGPASFLSAQRPDGTSLFESRQLTAFTDEEETQAGFAGKAPWLLEDRLRATGAKFEAGSRVGLSYRRRRQPDHRPEPCLLRGSRSRRPAAAQYTRLSPRVRPAPKQAEVGRTQPCGTSHMRNGDWRRAHKTDRYATRARGKAEQATRSARPRVSRGVGGDAAGRVYAPHGACSRRWAAGRTATSGVLGAGLALPSGRSTD
jgi:putative intracellular protease/amidase